MTGRLVCVVIPYKDFKEKIRITKENKEHKIEIYNDFILVSIRRKGKNEYTKNAWRSFDIFWSRRYSYYNVKSQER